MPRVSSAKLRPKRWYDLTGRECGKLTVRGRARGGWLCDCSCGGEVVLSKQALDRGRPDCGNCGERRLPVAPRERRWRTPTRVKGRITTEYAAWLRLRQTVAARLHPQGDELERVAADFDEFIKCVPPRPPGTGWALRKVRCRLEWHWARAGRFYRRQRKPITYSGRQWTQAALAKHLGLSRTTLRKGLRRKLTPDQIRAATKVSGPQRSRQRPAAPTETPDDENRVEY